MENSRLDLYTSIVPSHRQTLIQEMGFNAFVHFGMTTFTEKEWGDGKTPASTFNPTNLNTDQWIEALKAAGAKGAILTAKHHDGFCLWPSKMTEYSVKNSPYKDGKGDIVREFSDSCRKYGLKFGFYLSPWDRNSDKYGTPYYNDFYIEQLKELLTGYGDVFCVWLDGACGAYMDGKEKQVYDFDRIYATVREYQPDACVSSCGPDVRWVGNEGGYARQSEWNVVPKFAFDLQTIADNSQQTNDPKFRKKGADVVASDLGSREVLSQYSEFIWYPAEVDVSIRPGWFYHKREDHRVRSLNNLLNIYYNSVGGNSLLLLNAPPTKEGLLHERDVRRLHELGDAIRSAFQNPIKVKEASGTPWEEGHSPIQCFSEDESYYTPKEEAESYELKFLFHRPKLIDKVQLKEQCAFSQRVEAFQIYALQDGREKKVYDGTVIGYNKVALFSKPVRANGIKLVITKCRKKPYLRQVRAYGTDGRIVRKPMMTRIKVAAHQLSYKLFIARENKENK